MCVVDKFPYLETEWMDGVGGWIGVGEREEMDTEKRGATDVQVITE